MTEAANMDVRILIDRIARRERGRLVAGLVSRLGASHLDLAEDTAQEALIRALSSWSHKGVPDNPSAWLKRVAYNRALDHLRRDGRLQTFEEDEANGHTSPEQIAGDPELDLMVLCCDPALKSMDQLIFTLKTVCGFTARDTAQLFGTNENAIAQRLARAKRVLKAQDALTGAPTRIKLAERLPVLARTLYLMFAWGYQQARGQDLIRRDVCVEAIRLCQALIAMCQSEPEYKLHLSDLQALLALFLLQAARFPARLSEVGDLILLKDQDRNVWDRKMIADGFMALRASQSAPAPRRYHLEAAIAGIHAATASWQETDWVAIIGLYDKLYEVEPSEFVRINQAVAYIEQGDATHAAAILKQASCDAHIANQPAYYLALARLAEANGKRDQAITHLQQARSFTALDPLRSHIDLRLEVLN